MKGHRSSQCRRALCTGDSSGSEHYSLTSGTFLTSSCFSSRNFCAVYSEFKKMVLLTLKASSHLGH